MPVPIDNNVSNIFTLEQLFTIPLEAVVKANAYAAQSAIDIIRKYGFINAPHGDSWGKIRFVEFSYEYNENGQLKTMIIKIPMLSLIPIPLLEVKKAVFDFGVKIIDYTNNQATGESSDTPPFPTVHAMIVPVNKDNNVVTLLDQPSLTANLNVHVEMEKADLPAGILQMINLGQQATQGQTKETYVISVKPDQLNFSQKNLELEFDIRLSKTDDSSLSDGKIVKVEIGTNDSKQPFPFKTPPVIIGGSAIGTPSNNFLRVLSTDEGVITLLFKAEVLKVDTNGYINISTSGADPVKIYYSYNA